ncbi:phosphoglycerate mutase family protein [Kocuria palustris]|nr:phosphoglycerate mutase family protein [Kocuria palustris]
MRHGESAANQDKSVNQITPNHKVDLTETGKRQAQAAGEVLRQFLCHELFDQPLEDGMKCKPRLVWFYTSPYLRARETCRYICEGINDLDYVSYKIHEEPRMREQDFGNFQLTPEEMERIWEERAHYGHFFYRIPHGELAADVYDRVLLFNETLFRKFELEDFPNVLVLVTHGIWARVFLMRWFRWTYEEFELLKNIPHCKYLIMKRGSDNRYTLKSRLETWDDIDDDNLECNVAEEVSREVRFNSRGKIDHLEDMDIQAIIDAQRDAIKDLRGKLNRIREMYARARDQLPLPPGLRHSPETPNHRGSVSLQVPERQGRAPQRSQQ